MLRQKIITLAAERAAGKCVASIHFAFIFLQMARAPAHAAIIDAISRARCRDEACDDARR